MVRKPPTVTSRVAGKVRNIGSVSSPKLSPFPNSSPTLKQPLMKPARSAIASGVMTGTIKQDAESMALAIKNVAVNLIEGRDAFDGIDESITVDGRRINIPYSAYTGE